MPCTLLFLGVQGFLDSLNIVNNKITENGCLFCSLFPSFDFKNKKKEECGFEFLDPISSTGNRDGMEVLCQKVEAR
ncbi:hypothetical protein CH367_08670 [Leptospira barantonii]|uniref:Uncharacterized protein n=1 Tax=Leptospira barantonii TaxID=2023184 RepID=A0ABX4NKT9_9LEPT|nr:hypothetical protein CH367_08670 [Leptospira barantonii]